MTCLWPLPEGQCMPEDWNTLPEQHQYRGRLLASRTMERLTGGQVGVCPVTILLEPTDRVCCSGFDASLVHGSTPFVVNWGGTWHNCGCGSTAYCELVVPGPVGRVDSVKVNGVTVDPANYRVENGNAITWIGAGPCQFPQGNSEVEVTYLNAYVPEADGLFAASTLAYEFARACAGRQCKLPTNVSSIVRQGISMTITPGSFPGGKTGIHEVDAYLGQWNPNGLLIPSQVWSPDLPSYRTIGG